MFPFQLLFAAFCALTPGVFGTYGDNYAQVRGKNLSYAFSPKNHAGGSAAASMNLQTFKDALDAIEAPPITMSNIPSQPFNVQGRTYADFQTAAAETCQIQYTKCSEVALNMRASPESSSTPKEKKSNDLTMQECMEQKTACNAAQNVAPFQTFSLENLGADPASPEFDLLCAP